MINIALCGLGKAGSEFVKQVINSDKYNLSLVIARKESLTVGKSVSSVLNIVTPEKIMIKSIEEVGIEDQFDIIVDFSNGDTTIKLIELCEKFNKNIVICPTNFTSEQIERFKQTSKNMGIVYAPTLTIGINMLIDFVKKLSSLFPMFNFEIIERHGKNKSKPTETSKIISDAIEKKDVNISSVRLDGYVGVHEVTATNGSERISIIHESLSRKAFVDGALLAVEFIHGKKGYYEMKDIFSTLIKDYHDVF